jgi:hypothetical protein
MLTSATELTPQSVEARSPPRRHPWRLRDGPASDVSDKSKRRGKNPAQQRRHRPTRRGKKQTSQRNSCSPTPAPPRRIRPAIRWAGCSDLAKNGGDHPPAAIHRAQAVATRKTTKVQRKAGSDHIAPDQPAKSAHAKGRKSGARAPSERSPACPSGRSGVEVRPGPLVAKHSVWPG